MDSVDSVFVPSDASWMPVSRKLATARRIALSLTYILVVVGGAVLAWSPLPRWLLIGYVLAAPAIFVWAWWMIGRRVAAYGYAERDDDFIVVSGILVRRLVIVPYGRMQMVDLRAGPIDRWLGIATVQLHTAAATTDAAIPGLTPPEASALRDRLAARGEARSAGL